jgi:hypothetical protein
VSWPIYWEYVSTDLQDLVKASFTIRDVLLDISDPGNIRRLIFGPAFSVSGTSRRVVREADFLRNMFSLFSM